jgi:hypothetical protein
MKKWDFEKVFLLFPTIQQMAKSPLAKNQYSYLVPFGIRHVAATLVMLCRVLIPDIVKRFVFSFYKQDNIGFHQFRNFMR